MKQVIRLTEEDLHTVVKESVECILNESLGAFESQYELAIELANVAYNMFKNDISEKLYQTKNDSIIQLVQLNVKNMVNLPQISGFIYGFNLDEKKLMISLRIDKRIHFNDNEIDLKQHIANVITHELMHGYVYFNRYNNEVDCFDTPNYYDKILELIRNTEEDSLLYWFCYALYSAYYQETNAIISQTRIQMFNILDYNEKHSNEEIKKSLKQTDGYILFSKILNETIPTIKSLSEEELIKWIVSPMHRVGMDFVDVKWIMNQCSKIEKISKDAIYRMMKNAMLQGKNIKEYFYI